MKPFVALLLVLAACPSPRETKRWNSSLVFGVVYRCIEGGRRFAPCACYADEMQRISPDPDERATDEQKAQAMKACGIELEDVDEGEPFTPEAL